MKRVKRITSMLFAVVLILTTVFQSFAAVQSYARPVNAGSDAVKTTGIWTKDGDTWKFSSNEGEVKDGWFYLNSSDNSNEYKWYCFDANGNMRTGWIQDKTDPTVWYYVSEVKDATEGSLVTGWLTDPQDGKKYYLDPVTGIMAYGWRQIDGNWYYFGEPQYADGSWTLNSNGYWVSGKGAHPFGSMYVNEKTPDGYYVGRNGIWNPNGNSSGSSGGSDTPSVKKYSVKFDMQGHGTQVSGQSVKPGERVNEPDEPAIGDYAEDGYYVFDGWYKEAACINEWNFESDIVTVDITLYAKWNRTIAGILSTVDDFPKGSPSEPPEDAWVASESDAECYLSQDGSELIFFNPGGDPATVSNVDSSETVTKDGNSYLYTDGDSLTVTFNMSGSVLLSIEFYDINDDTWNDTYHKKSSCVAAGTMITLGNGEQKAVENLEIGDVIRTFNHETGEVSSSPVCFIFRTENASNAFTLTFEDDTENKVEVTVIEEHGFYDREEKQYAFINADNTEDYIGHHFYDADNDCWLELTSFKVSDDLVDAYAIITSGDLNHLSNGMLSMCDGTVKMLANIFEYDDQMKFDAIKKNRDIEEHGLTPKEKVLKLAGFYDSAYEDYKLQYLNIAVGKGLTTWELIGALGDYCEANGL